MKRIVLTGGGTAGHVTPNLAIIPRLQRQGYDIHYIGTNDGIEKQLLQYAKVPYHSITAGKLRRYLDMKNVTDTLKITKGFMQALGIVRKLKPDVVFSKGGFVSCPVVWAAWVNRIPVVLHESDMTPGLANKLSLPFASKICYTFPETSKHIPEGKGILTGIPVRESLLTGSAEKGRSLCGFSDRKPVILVTGGSQGAEILNRTVRTALNDLLAKFQICHLCGKGGTDASLNSVKGYRQFEYVNDELPHLFAMSDVLLSRAGATTLFEILALKKPNLLVPLSLRVSRGDQILNAKSFQEQGFSHVMEEEAFTPEALVKSITELYNSRSSYIKAMDVAKASSSADIVIDIIDKACKKQKA